MNPKYVVQVTDHLQLVTKAECPLEEGGQSRAKIVESRSISQVHLECLNASVRALPIPTTLEEVNYSLLSVQIISLELDGVVHLLKLKRRRLEAYARELDRREHERDVYDQFLKGL